MPVTVICKFDGNQIKIERARLAATCFSIIKLREKQ